MSAAGLVAGCCCAVLGCRCCRNRPARGLSTQCAKTHMRTPRTPRTHNITWTSGAQPVAPCCVPDRRAHVGTYAHWFVNRGRLQTDLSRHVRTDLSHNSHDCIVLNASLPQVLTPRIGGCVHAGRSNRV
eukprot:353924-Chlamydomonas_euryale.AAC.5